MKRWLKKNGCQFIEGKKHTIVILGRKRTTLPRHPAVELKTKTMHTILKDLGLKK